MNYNMHESNAVVTSASATENETEPVWRADESTLPSAPPLTRDALTDAPQRPEPLSIFVG